MFGFSIKRVRNGVDWMDNFACQLHANQDWSYFIIISCRSIHRIISQNTLFMEIGNDIIKQPHAKTSEYQNGDHNEKYR
jgi:hypothetical protein